jgi:hypothetical protein
LRGFAFLRRLVGLIPSQKGQTRSGNHVEPSKPWPRAPLAELDPATPPTHDEIDTQMRFSAAMSRCLDQGMSYDDAKDYVEACADDIKAGMQTPWRRKVGENRYQAECGCIFNSDRLRVYRCRDHRET